MLTPNFDRLGRSEPAARSVDNGAAVVPMLATFTQTHDSSSITGGSSGTKVL